MSIFLEYPLEYFQNPDHIYYNNSLPPNDTMLLGVWGSLKESVCHILFWKNW
jgi:hypothetical protein